MDVPGRRLSATGCFTDVHNFRGFGEDAADEDEDDDDGELKLPDRPLSERESDLYERYWPSCMICSI